MKSKLDKLIALFALPFCFASCAKESYTTSTSTVFASSIVSTVSVLGADNAAKECEDAAKALDWSINPYLSSSYIARFNAMSAGEMEVDEYVYTLFDLSKKYNALTFGAFDPTLSALSTAWSVDSGSLTDSKNDPDSVVLPDHDLLGDYKSHFGEISAREEDGRYYLSKTSAEASLDFGGIAKGYLTDLYAAILANHSAKSALCDVSGNLYLKGKRYDGAAKKDWKIGVANCFGRGGAYLTGLVSGGDEYIVTSGTYERYYTKDGVKYCHLIDPFTRMPVGVEYDGAYKQSESYLISVTVIGDEGAKCDALATAVCVLGAQKGSELLDSLSLKAVIVTSDGKYKAIGDVRLLDGYMLGELEAL